MSPTVERVLVEESEIIITVRVRVDLGAHRLLDHLANEGKIQEAVRLVGHQATETLYQQIVDRYNETEGYENADGYWMRQDTQNTKSYVGRPMAISGLSGLTFTTTTPGWEIPLLSKRPGWRCIV